ncbi:mbc [Bugula neritina]|uniref:Mbc n=1 Tax=Bugula neritina TaxID=10212 RepID=A0A7J7IUM4_BUGNE|nr:mbc [Bugula neritina]
MAQWKEFKRLGIVVSHYRPSESDSYHMPVCVGDTLHILETDGDWYRGFLIRDRTVKGIVPASYVHIKDCSIVKIGNDESMFSKDPAIVQEITSVLREWGLLLRNLFISNKMADFRKIEEMMLKLITIRRDMMSKKLTKDDYRQKQLEATAKIDYGNMLLGLDLTVRDEDGEVINSECIGAIELFRQHRTTLERNAQRRKQPDNRLTQRHTLNLFVSVCNVICRVGDEVDVIMALYDATSGKFFSENYVIKYSQKGMLKDLDLLNNLRVLFSDLGSKDLRTVREKVFLVCQVVRLGGMFPPVDNEGKPVKLKNILRRPFGVAALDVTSILNGDISYDEDKQHFVPILPCSRNDSLESVIKEAVKVEEVTQRTHKGQGIWVSVRLLDGDLKQVKEEYPHLIVGHTAVARKMGFPEVIMPADVRNDFYVTINSGDFSQRNLGERNIEMTMQVCSRDGKSLGIRKDSMLIGRQSADVGVDNAEITHNVISVGGGADLQSEYKSVIYRHQDTPRWFETFKVAVPIEEFYNCHLKFTFKHVSENRDNKPFAMSHVSFISSDETTLADGEHDLLVYSIDTKKSSDMLAYLRLPTMTTELDKVRGDKSSKAISQGPYTLTKNNSFQITTLACSTKLTHNVDLLGLLNWRANPAKLPIHLKNLMKVDGEEIVKFLQHTLDALFAILMQNSDTGIYDKLVFDALQRASVLLKRFYKKLTTVLTNNLDNVDIPDNQDILYRSFKSIVYIMKLIIRSWLLFAALYDNKGSVQFEVSMRQLFQSIATMMCQDTNHTLKIQGAVLKFLPGVIPDLVRDKAMDRNELASLLIQMIQNVPKDRLSNQKLVFILDIVNSPLFKFAEPRQMLLLVIVEHVDIVISNQSKELDVCAKIVADIVHQTCTIPSAREDLRLLFKERDLLRTIIQTVINMDRSSSLAQDYTAIMIAILRQMSDTHYSIYLDTIPEPEHAHTYQNLADFLTEIIMVFQDLIKACVFPPDWNEMIMVQNQVFLKALRCFSQTIKEKFSTPFEQQLWNNFFHCAISFLTQDALQLENFSSSKKRKIIARYKDMRRAMGFEIRSMWSNLGQKKIRFIPELVGPILEMTLIPETELRKATLPIFFDMMQCEFYQMVRTSHGDVMNGNFRQFENELITQMDVQVEGGHGDEQYIELFYVTIHEPCAKHQVMRDQGLRFVEVIKKLLMRLLEYRTIIHDENKDNRMNCIVNLLNFYRDIDRQEMYIRYLHKLCDLHLECNNFTEAACTLMLYTRLLRRKQADQYNKIQSETRHPPNYYRVSYYGNGFPAFLSNKTFIYRGKEYEMLGEFSSRIREVFPNAKVLSTLNPPNHEILESAGKFLQINAVNPVFKPQPQFVGKTVSEQILKYWKSNEVDMFTYSRPLNPKKTGEISDMWLEKTDLRTESILPGILRWFPVKEHHTYKVSPLENAIENMDSTNTKLQIIIEDHLRQPELQINPLSMLLNGICDAAVNGGLANYKPFFSGEYTTNGEGDEEPRRTKKEQSELIYKLKNLTTQQVDRVQHCASTRLCVLRAQRPCHTSSSKKHSKASLLSSYGQSNMTQDAAVTQRKTSTPEKLIRTSSGGGLFKPSIIRDSLSSPGKGHSKANIRNSGRVPSTYSTDSKDSVDSAEKEKEKKVDGPVIELNQTAKTPSNRLVQWLTSARPPRPESKAASKSRPSSGYNTSIRWESTASLTVNDSFDDASESVTCSTPTSAISTPNRVSAISDTLSNSRQRASSPVVKSNNETSSGPPPLPRKQSQVDTTDSTYMSPHSVRMRKHSHKGLPAPALPPSKTAQLQSDLPPALPEKRASVGTRSNDS